jgi:murein DD-endopeptidase MepM/ murein hydrolase activator NlpD
MNIHKSYSILIVPFRGTQIRRLEIPRWLIRSFLGAGIALFSIISISGWLLTDYKFQIARETKLRVATEKEVGTVRAQLEEQWKELFKLQNRIKTSQQTLANWKGLRKKIHASLPKKNRSSFNGKEVVKELGTSLELLQGGLEGLIASIPSEWPTKGWISSGFGKRSSPWTGESEFHTGVDIGSRHGTPVRAPGDGVVKFRGRYNGNGRTIIMDHGQGITTRYGHLSKINVKKGERIRKNQKIGNVGNTGKSTNPHLHYEIRVNGIPINPRRHILKNSVPRTS